MANSILNCHSGERSTWLAFTDEERDVLVAQDHVALFELGAHPFLTLTLFIAMFERDHGPLEYQIAYGQALKHLLAALPRHRDLTCAPPSSTRPGSPPSYAEHPAPAAGAGIDAGPGDGRAGRAARPAVRVGHVVLRRAGDAVRAGRSGRRRRRVVGRPSEPGRGSGSSRPAGMQPGDGSLAELCAVPDADVVPIEAAVPGRAGRRPRAVGGRGVDGAVVAGAAAARRAGAGARRRRRGRSGRDRRRPGCSARRTVVAVARPASVVARRGRRARTSSSRSSGDVDALAAALAEHGPFDVVLDPVFGVAADRGRRGAWRRAAGWSTSAARRATRRRSPRPVLRSRTASVLGYTNNALTSDQRAEAITAVLGHAAAGRIRMQYDVRPLAEVEQVWTARWPGRPSRAASWCPEATPGRSIPPRGGHAPGVP